MADLVPTKRRVRWGSERWQLYDYYAHPTRDDGGNPVFIFRHGGGGSGGHFEDVWRENLEWIPLFNYLHSASRSKHFDIISVSSAQRSFTEISASAPLTIPRTRQVFFPHQADDLQLAVASIKAQGLTGINGDPVYLTNPDLYILGGQSYGATVSGWAVMRPPLVLNTVEASSGDFGAVDSTVRGCFYMDGQIDCRDISGTAYQNAVTVGAWYGTRSYNGTTTEWDALDDRIKNAMSLRWYFEEGHTDHAVPFYILYRAGVGDGVLPLAEAHDTIQLTDLAVAIKDAGLAYVTDTYTSVMSTGNSSAAYDWMAACIHTDDSVHSSSKGYAQRITSDGALLPPD